MRRGTKPSKPKVESKCPAAPKSRKREGSRVRDLEERLAETLQRETEGLKREAQAQEQRAATAEILRVISSSPTDVQPVFDTIAEHAWRLCDAAVSGVCRFDGELIHVVALGNVGFDSPIARTFPMPPSGRSAAARAVLTADVVHIPDVLEDRDYGVGAQADASGFRSALAVPMLREGAAIGSIVVGRNDPSAFSERHIELLKTFADQAVIAIENVRLFKELEARNGELTQSLDRQTATAEILRVIGTSPTDAEPVFETIARSAVRVCGALSCGVFVVDQSMVRLVATHGVPAERLERFRSEFPAPLTSPHDAVRAIRERTFFHMADIENNPGASREQVEVARLGGYRTRLMVPMARGDVAVGLIAVTGAAPAPFSERQVELLQTFADQAVIAIENVRLFNETKEALEQQTATSEILRVIASSPTDIQPVLDALAESANRLCRSVDCSVFLLDDDHLVLGARHGPSREVVGEFTIPIVRGTVGGRTVLERRTIHVLDLPAEADEFPQAAQNARTFGFRTMLSVPLIREGAARGVIQLRRSEVNPFTERQAELLKTFADQAVIAIENVRLFTELQEKNRALTQAHAQVTEALEYQTATSEVLRVISSSPTDIQPVFDMLARSARQLCNGEYCVVESFDGARLHFGASDGLSPEGLAAFQQALPRLVSEDNAAGRAVLRRTVVQIPDVREDAAHGVKDVALAANYRSAVAAPMLRDRQPIGAIVLARSSVGVFPDRQVELLKTFADQAVIAIENVRLFKELEQKNKALTQAHAQVSEALEQQTATSEILRVISSSPTDLQPVFDMVVRNAVTLCGAAFGGLHRIDSGRITLDAHYGVLEDELMILQRDVFPLAISRGSAAGRAILDREVVHIPDIREDPGFRTPRVKTMQNYRTLLAVPMIREGVPLGALALWRREVQPFGETEIGLVRTFADQAVIAIENVRLFTELQASNRELTTALDTQTATSDILRVISRSQTDVQPVFDAIIASAVHLLGGHTCGLTRVTGDQLELVALTSIDAAADAPVRAAFPQSLHAEGAHPRAIRDRVPLNVADAHADARLAEGERAFAGIRGFRSWVVVPMLRDDVTIGSIGVTRREAGGFTADEIALLETFADQAVIAIENVRLFTELQEKNQALTAAHAEVTETLEQQTATADVLKIISRSTFDLQPVLNTLIESATRLCGADKGFIFRRDADVYRGVADSGTTPEHREYIRRTPVRVDRSTVVGRVALERRTIHFPDILLDPEYQWAEAQRIARFRTVLGVPMLRGGEPIGAFFIWREQVRPFTDKQIELVTTFADQAVIAIENTRLLSELRARTDDLTRSVGQLTALGEVGRAVSSTLDLETVLSTIVSRAVQLSGLDGGVVFEYDESAEEFVQRAMTQTSEVLAEARRATRIRKGEGVLGRTATTLEPVQVADIAIPGAYEGRLRDVLIDSGIRAILAVPMVREDHLIGCLGVTRNSPGEFPAATIELLRTFATQSALAIQNARLFREIEQKSRELEAASRHKSEFLANMSHELRTPLNAVIGFSEVLSERMFGDLNEKQDEYLKDIHASGQHLLSLINDILDLSKIEAGRMELELSDFDLPMTIDNALTLVRERAARRSIALHTTVDERIGQIQADERKIRQVLLNLLSNAIKFTPEGGQIDVEAKPVDGSVQVSVRDTGVGIAPEDQEAVFEEFKQVGTADKKVEGTGLGLALSRKFIELHGGKIWVMSQVGAGSTFTFTVPVRRGQ